MRIFLEGRQLLLERGERGFEARLLGPEFAHAPPDGSNFRSDHGRIADS
ncbi:MAG TPA: hypothetical protein VF776_07190 [Sphingomicrobium sp.]